MALRLRPDLEVAGVEVGKPPQPPPAGTPATLSCRDRDESRISCPLMNVTELLTLLQIVVIVVGGGIALGIMRSQMGTLTAKVSEVVEAVKDLGVKLTDHDKRISRLEWNETSRRTKR